MIETKTTYSIQYQLDDGRWANLYNYDNIQQMLDKKEFLIGTNRWGDKRITFQKHFIEVLS